MSEQVVQIKTQLVDDTGNPIAGELPPFAIDVNGNGFSKVRASNGDGTFSFFQNTDIASTATPAETYQGRKALVTAASNHLFNADTDEWNAQLQVEVLDNLGADTVISTQTYGAVSASIQYQYNPKSLQLEVAKKVLSDISKVFGTINSSDGNVVPIVENLGRESYFIQNNGPGTIWLDYGTPAVSGECIKLLPGQTINSEIIPTTDSINLIGEDATDAQYTAYEGT